MGSSRVSFLTLVDILNDARVSITRNKSYLQECDLLLQDIVPSYLYQQLIDTTVPWVYTTASILMPAPAANSFNINAVIKPFQWPVQKVTRSDKSHLLIILNFLS